MGNNSQWLFINLNSHFCFLKIKLANFMMPFIPEVKLVVYFKAFIEPLTWLFKNIHHSATV